MSSQLSLLNSPCSSKPEVYNFKDIVVIVDKKYQRCFKRAHVGKYLGLVYIHRSTTKLAEKDHQTRASLEAGPIRHMDQFGPKAQQSKTDKVTSFGAVADAILNSRRPKAIELAEAIGISIRMDKLISREQETISATMKMFKGVAMIDQYGIDAYRIDLYFPEYRLAIECDEFDHKDRVIGYEILREKNAESRLGCTFICYNPDANDFQICDVFNNMFRFIYIKEYYMKGSKVLRFSHENFCNVLYLLGTPTIQD